MASVLIVYGTTEGHTRKIATKIAEWVAEAKHQPTLVDSAKLPHDFSIYEFDAYILAASLHMSKHQSSLEHFTKHHRDMLSNRPSLFISVSLTAVVKDAEHQKAARDYMERFYDNTGWRPSEAHAIAGALLYTEYDFIKRMLMKMIARAEGGETDTSHDFEYTDWEELKGFVREFLASASGTGMVA